MIKTLPVSDELAAAVRAECARIQKHLSECPRADTGRSVESELSMETLLDAQENPGAFRVCESKRLINFSSLMSTKRLLHFLIDQFPGCSITPSGNFLYPDNGFMGWHTNSNEPFTRCYITFVDDVGLSGFKYLNSTGQIITDVDDEPIKIRVFDTPEAPSLFWHSVYSKCNRYSFGFKIIKNL